LGGNWFPIPILGHDADALPVVARAVTTACYAVACVDNNTRTLASLCNARRALRRNMAAAMPLVVATENTDTVSSVALARVGIW
jgi:hypothetical protein